MNSPTTKLLRKVAIAEGYTGWRTRYHRLKHDWNKMPRNLRHALRVSLMELL